MAFDRDWPSFGFDRLADPVEEAGLTWLELIAARLEQLTDRGAYPDGLAIFDHHDEMSADLGFEELLEAAGLRRVRRRHVRSGAGKPKRRVGHQRRYRRGRCIPGVHEYEAH